MRILDLAAGLTPWRVFDEHKALMGACLADLGVTKPVTLVYGAHIVPEVLAGMDPARTVVFQGENVRGQGSLASQPYLDAIKGFRCIDYARENEGAYECAGWAYLPTLHHTVAERFAPVDPFGRVCGFVGSINQRRQRLLNRIGSAGFSALPAFNVFGAERDRFLAGCGVVLNLHFYEPPAFEALRVADALSNGCIVVTEPGGSVLTQAEYADFAIMASADELPDAVGRAVRDMAAHRERAARFRKTDMRPEVARVLRELDI